MTAFRKLTSREISHASALTWYALSVRPQQEFTTQRILKRMGITAFVPQEWRFRKKSRYCGQKHRFDVPAYPRVVFLGVPKGLGFPWSRISDIHLITGYIARPDDKRPQVFRTQDIEQIMKWAKTPLFVRPDERVYEEPGFTPGEPVEIKDGPLAGIELTITKVEGMSTFCKFAFMGREVEQELPPDVLVRRWAA